MLYLHKEQRNLNPFFQNTYVKNVCPYKVEDMIKKPGHLPLMKAPFGGSPVASWLSYQ